MDMPGWLIDFPWGFPLWATGIAISAVFFREGRQSPPGRRIVSAAHGALAAIAFTYAAVTSAFTMGASRAGVRALVGVLMLLLIVSLASIGMSFVWFDGRRRYLWLHAITLAMIQVIWIFGSMMIANAWP